MPRKAKSSSRDHLSRLPDDILEWITSLVGYSYVLPPLNRRLYRLYSAARYPSTFNGILVDSPRRAKLIGNILSKNPAIGPYIEQLTITVDDNDEGDSDYFPALEPIFDHLPKLRMLSVFYADKTAEHFLKSKVSKTAPNLVEVLLYANFDSLEDPFDAQHYVELSQLRHLKVLVVQVDRNSAIKNKTKNAFYPKNSFLSLKSLELIGPLSSSKGPLSFFTGPKLDILSLYDTTPTSHLSSLLQSVGYPSILFALKLTAPSPRKSKRGGHPTNTPQDLARALPRFSTVKNLTLNGSACGTGPEFRDALRKLPLEDLIFDFNTDPSIRDLLDLVSGKGRHPTLGTIRLDHVEGREGDWLKSRELHDWTLPKWGKGLTSNELQILRDVAGHNGIRVTGSAVDALRLEERFEKRLRKEETIRA